jgi:hypothetical protein
MQDEGDTMQSDSSRTAIDRHAVIVAAHLLVSAIWLEQRVRRLSPRLITLPNQRPSVVAVVSSSASDQSDRGLLVPDRRGD